MLLIRKLTPDKGLVINCFILRYHEAQKTALFQAITQSFPGYANICRDKKKKNQKKNTLSEVCANYRCNSNCNCEIQRFQKNHIIY